MAELLLLAGTDCALAGVALGSELTGQCSYRCEVGTCFRRQDIGEALIRAGLARDFVNSFSGAEAQMERTAKGALH